MQIEEYRVEEISSEEMATLAADGNAAMLIDSLRLEGQKKLMSVTGTRQPFRRITRVEELVFKELFPEVSVLAKFDTEIIPVRVLELAKEAIDTGKFCKLEVWHSRTRRDDPILVAVEGTPNPQSWDSDYVTRTADYLVARWGRALLPFEQLQAEAVKTWTAKTRAALSKEIDEATARLKRIDQTAQSKFISGESE